MDPKNSIGERSRRLAFGQKETALVCGLGALALTLGVRLFLFANYYTINNDGVLYVDAARHFWRGDWEQGLASFYPPLFPLLIAAAFPLTGDWELAGQFWPFVLGVLVLVPLFALLRDLHGAKAAWAALLFYSVSPYLARLSLHVRSEIPYIFFAVLSLYWLQRGLARERGWPFWLAGVGAALAYLIRSEGLGLVAAGGLYVIYWGWWRGRLGPAMVHVAGIVLGFALFSAPYVLYLKADTGNWLLSRKAGMILSLGLADIDPEVERVSMEESDRVSLIRMIASHPFTYAKKVFIDTFRSWGVFFEALHYTYLPFLLLGWLIFLRDRFWQREEFVLFLVIVFYLESFSLLYVNRRYAVPLALFALGWVGTGYLAVLAYCRDRWKAKTTPIAVVVAALFMVGTLPKTLRSIGKDKYYLREAGTYLRNQPGAPTIVTTDQRVWFYAEAADRIVLLKTVDELPGIVVSEEADYLALDRESLQRVESAIARQGWRLEKEYSDGERDTVLVWRRPSA